MSEVTSLNSYQVLESIHRSRRFSLYRATKYDTGREVLIKTPDPVRSKEPELINTLMAETAAHKQLNHPNIRAYYDSTDDIGSAFLIGEYIEGISLARYLNQNTPPPSLETVLVWVTDLLQALVHAHSLGIKHLNLNPHNLIVTTDKHLKIIGFGKDKAAWMNGEAQDFGFHPILFIAPELFQAGIEGPASDIYSVAVLAYLCTTGVMPWRIDYTLGSVQQKKQSLCRAVIMPEIMGVQMPDWLYGIILSCLKLDPHQRIDTAADFLDAISTQGSSLPLEVKEDSPILEEPAFVIPEPEPEPSLIVAELEEPEPESVKEPGMPTPVPEPIPVIGPPKPSTPKPSAMYNMNPMRRKPEPEPEILDTRSLYKTFKLLLWMSLIVFVFYIFKYFVFEKRPKFTHPDDSTAVEEISTDPAEKNRPLTMVLLPADTLVMGSIAPEAEADEFPLVTVKLSPFYMSPKEITQEEWMMVFPSNPSQNRNKELPVENVSFYDVIEFCNAKSIKDGFSPCYDYIDTEVVCDFDANGYRLPTEAEWESATKTGRKSDFTTYSGSNVADEVGWNNINSNAHSHPGGKKAANSLGLYDLSGNLFEWVWNWYAPYSYRIPDLFKGAEYGTDKVIRGGSWYHAPSEMRVTNRSYAKPYTKSAFIGFRVVRSIGNRDENI